MKTHMFVLCQENSNITLKGSNGARRYPPLRSISAECQILDENNRPSVLRYIPSQPTIFKREQDLDSDFPVHMAISKPCFTNGILMVTDNEQVLLEFLRAHRNNEDNASRYNAPVVFREVKREEIAKKMNDESKLRVSAVRLVFESDFMKKVRPVANFLGYDINRESDVIMHDMQIYANNNPQKFIDLLNSAVVERYQEVVDAEAAQVISITPTRISWIDGRNILDVPASEDAAKYFARMSYDVKYIATWNEIVRQMRPVEIEEDIERVTVADELRSKQNKELFDLAVGLGIIINDAMWYKYEGYKKKGKEAFIRDMPDEIRNLIIAEIGQQE
jgi:hypothetical protein